MVRSPENGAEHPNRRALKRLHQRLRSLSTKTDLLHELVGAGHFDEMAMTRDGLLIARPRRCLGFDAFIGRPTPSMLSRTARLWNELNRDERRLVLERLAQQSIAPERIGLPLIELEAIRVDALASRQAQHAASHSSG